MKVTFVGGPRHGEHDDITDPPQRLQVKDDDGKPIMYELVSQMYQGVGNGPMSPFWSTYAIVNTPMKERIKLSREVGFPPDLF